MGIFVYTNNLIITALLMGVMVLVSSRGHAAPTETVMNLNDSGAGSLRDAIANVTPGGSINISVAGTIILTSGELLINKNLTINGPGAERFAISGNNASRVFNISSGTVFINDVTIRDGAAGIDSDGGGIFNDGKLTLTNSTVRGNSAHSGGGIGKFFGTLTLTNVTVSGNSATYAGGGISSLNGISTLTNVTVSGNTSLGYGGGILNGGSLTMTNSTVSGNTASFGGGFSTSKFLFLTNVTVSGNTAGVAGGGIYSASFVPTINLLNTIVANSVSGGDCVMLYGTVTDNGNNIVEDTVDNCGVGLHVDPLLGPLADNGGLTRTHELLVGSPAIDSGSNTAGSHPIAVPTDDQRGFIRPQDGDQDGIFTVDIGSFELIRFCGDGIKNNGEQCDFNDPNAPADCSTNCTLPPPSVGFGGQEPYITVIGEDTAYNGFYISPKEAQFLHTDTDYLCESFDSSKPVNQPNLCVIHEGENNNPFVGNTARIGKGNSGKYKWDIVLPKKLSGDFTISIQCGILKPNETDINECAGETGEVIGPSCTRGADTLNYWALPTIEVIAYPGPFSDVSFTTPFHLTAMRNPSTYGDFGYRRNTKNHQVLDGSKSSRIALKACFTKMIFAVVPLNGRRNALGEKEARLSDGDLISVIMDVPSSNTVDIYCYEESVKIQGIGEPGSLLPDAAYGNALCVWKAGPDGILCDHTTTPPTPPQPGGTAAMCLDDVYDCNNCPDTGNL